MKHARRFAWLVMVIADAGLLAWGAMAALAPDYLLGPGSKPILVAGYEGFTGACRHRSIPRSGTARSSDGVSCRAPHRVAAGRAAKRPRAQQGALSFVMNTAGRN
jgi:hypothetical protein